MASAETKPTLTSSTLVMNDCAKPACIVVTTFNIEKLKAIYEMLQKATQINQKNQVKVEYDESNYKVVVRDVLVRNHLTSVLVVMDTIKVLGFKAESSRTNPVNAKATQFFYGL
eukprot:274927_1